MMVVLFRVPFIFVMKILHEQNVALVEETQTRLNKEVTWPFFP